MKALCKISLLLACAALTACAPRLDPKARAQLDAHDAVLQDMPRDFYEPGLGDMMNALQLRHAKLWYAGAASNWELAAFELHEIEENLARVARWHADNEEIPMGPSIKAYTQAGRYALEQSITRRNRDEFTTAFDRFTQGCNDCHRAAKHGFIVIQRPSVEPYGNQRWEP